MTEKRRKPSSSIDPGYYEAVGRAIKVARTSRGIGRRELAERTGLSYPYLSEIETGKKQGSSRAMMLIAEALGLRPHQLLEMGESLQSRDWDGVAEPSAQVNKEVRASWFGGQGPISNAAMDDRVVMAMSAEPPPPAGGRTRGPRESRSNIGQQKIDKRRDLHGLVDQLADDDVETVLGLVLRLTR